MQRQQTQIRQANNNNIYNSQIGRRELNPYMGRDIIDFFKDDFYDPFGDNDKFSALRNRRSGELSLFNRFDSSLSHFRDRERDIFLK
jgi:hypothetical protein